VTNFQDANIKFNFKETRNTSLFVINSRNRDKNVYPQPTFFTLRLPRTFRNVKTLNISQVSLLNSFFNFSKANGNTYMNIKEEGRTIVGSSTNSVQITIRDGTYNASELVEELSSALNATPLFASITLSEFIAAFQSNGDYSPLFNTPGNVVYNALTQDYERNLTIQDIVARYFQVSQTLGSLTFSYNECSVAYYYPVMKEMMLDTSLVTNPPPFSVLGQSVPYGYSSWYDYIVFGFTGLTDAYITPMALDTGNQAIFTSYRNQRTFNTFLANYYTCKYNVKQGRLVISAPSLALSISSDLTKQYENILSVVVGSNSQFADVSDFNNQYNNVVNSNGFIIEFYNYIQARFSSNFAINFGSYSPAFYGVSTNSITIYNPNDNYGWNYTLTPAASETTTDVSSTIPPQVPNYWPNIRIPKTKNDPNISTFVSTITVPSFFGNYIFFSNSSESSYGYSDVPFKMLPTSYVRAAFASVCRQSISIMTLPRYSTLTDRTPATEEVYNLGSTTTSLLYKTVTTPLPAFYILTDISGNTLFNMYTTTQSMLYSADYMRAEDQWLNFTKVQILSGTRIQYRDANYNTSPPLTDVALTSYRPYMFFQVNADQYYFEANAHFNITFFVETQDGSNFPVPITITWYKDRAGFMADIATPLNGGVYTSENPRHYFKTQTFEPGTNSLSMVVDVNNLQQTYMYIHYKDSATTAASIPIRVFSVLTDTYGYGYRIATQDDKLDMPASTILNSLSDQFTPNSDVFKNPLTSIYDPAIFQLGYDSNNVSNNLLDYIIQTPNNLFYDPANITDYISGISSGLRYQYDFGTSGSDRPNPSISSPSIWSLYFGSNSQNLVRDTYQNNVYLSSLQTFTIVEPYNENTITNWFKPASANNEIFITPAAAVGYNIDTSGDTIFLPCINTTTPLLTDMSTTAAFYDNKGFSGLSFFLPPNNVVKMTTFVVKFAYTQPSADENGVNFSRTNSPYTSLNTPAYYQNRTSYTDATLGGDTDWDDWYLTNRKNMKLAIFKTGDISGAMLSDLSLNSALCSLSLKKITQVNNLRNTTGTLYTREPDWGTYYTYEYDSEGRYVWSPGDAPTPENPGWTPALISPPDIAPTYTSGNVSYPNFFLTHPVINNYTYLPRSYGIAPSVGNAVNNPYDSVPGGAVSDIPNSYTAVPFYYDSTTGWIAGTFFGVSFTRTPALPSTNIVGDAPFYGPPGIFGWADLAGYLQLYNGEQPTFQPYYWNSKITFENLYTEYNPATELAAFGGFDGIATEYQDTLMFVYNNNNINDDYKDISTTTTTWAWGNESNTNYAHSDDQSGYNLLSYLNNITVRSTVPEYAVHVRAYDPIPSFTTGLRFIGKNYTDFGSPTLTEIGTEISSLSAFHYQPISDASASAFVNGEPGFNPQISTNDAARLTNGNRFSHAYADQLILFDNTFKVSTISFGAKIGFEGVTLSNGFTGYDDAYTQYLQYYTAIRDQYSIFTSILSTTQGQLDQYIVSRYGTVLPSTVTSRNRFTDPIPFQLLLSTMLAPPYTNSDEWGLGYNLGFNKSDRPDQPRTTVTSDTFIRIVQDYVFMRINPEQNANSMGVSAQENLAETREPQAEDQKYFSKIILNDFGGYSRTAMIQPKEFNPVLGRLDTITLQLVNKAGLSINNGDCDYDMVLEITEVENKPIDTDTLEGPMTNLLVYRGETDIQKIREASGSGTVASQSKTKTLLKQIGVKDGLGTSQDANNDDANDALRFV